MRNNRTCIAGLAAAIAVVAFGLPALSGVERDATGAVGNDGSQVTRDQRELIEFKATLAALDDALMRNHFENYYKLNGRLKNMMQQELEQSRTRLRVATEERERRLRAQRMRATMGGSGVEFLDLDNERMEVHDEQNDIAAVKKRSSEMERLIQRFEALQLSVQEQDTRAYARNAALLDKFLELMRAERASAPGPSSAEN